MCVKRIVFMFITISMLSVDYSFAWEQKAGEKQNTAKKPNSGTPPNILFAIADDWGFHASIYGTPWIKTPHFDRVAKEGILFENVYTPNAKCAPSRACIITGRNSWQLKEAANHVCYFPQEFKSYPEVLMENGWHVGYVQKGWGPGIANDKHAKKRLLTGVAYNKQKCKPPAKGISGNDYAANFEDFLDDNKEGKPWCFWYGSVEPHRGYEYESGVKKGGKRLEDIDHVPGYWPDTPLVRNDMLDYAYEVEYFDQHLGRMLKTLEERNLLENTLVIVTSDHGMPFPRCKGGAYYDSNHVPFAAMWKKGIVKPGRKTAAFVSFVDLAPTFIELAGLSWKTTGMSSTPGKSLTEFFYTDTPLDVKSHRDHVLIGMERHDIGRPNDWGYPIRGIITKDHLLLKNYKPSRWPACNPETGYLNVDASPTKTLILEKRRSQGNESTWDLCFGKRPMFELYDLSKDPHCVANLAEQQELQKTRSMLLQQMESILLKQGDPRMLGKGDIFDNYLHSNKNHQGFYEKYMRGEKLKTGWVSKTDFEKEPIKD